MFPRILSCNLSPITYQLAVETILSWARLGESRSVFAANVHMVMTAYDNPKFQTLVNTADLVTPDGMPLVWAMHRMGYPQQERVYGPTLMLKLLEQATLLGVPVGFLGSTESTLKKLAENMKRKYPELNIAMQIAPPFRPITLEEDMQLTERINASGAKILFVGLGCPKQEIWISEHHGTVHAVMLGVGAAFDFHANTIRQAPAWMQRLGLEWLFRLIQEPRRLWKRYAFTNPRFMFLIGKQLLKEKIFGKVDN